MSKKFDFSFVIILALLVVAGGFSWDFYFRKYSQKDSVSIHEFPKKIGGWTSEEIPISDEDYAVLETRNAFARRYTGPRGQEVMILLVYSQDNRKVSHPPEICYTGSGAQILRNEPAVLEVDSSKMDIRTNKLTVELGRARQVIYYWFKIGDSFTSNYWRQQGLIALKSLMGKPTSSALIRLSSDFGAEGPARAEKNVQEFASVLVPNLFQYLP